MAEYIDRKHVYETACKGCIFHGNRLGSCNAEEPCGRLFEAFVSAPTIDPESLRPRGRWVEENEELYCSECGRQIPDCAGNADPIFVTDNRFCYYCGARMDGKENDNAKVD